MSDYTVLESRGTPEVGGENLSVFLYPNKSGDRYEAEWPVRNAVKDACDEIYENTSVQYYEISLYNSESEVNEVEGEDDGGTYFSNFKSWLSAQGYYDYNGVHLGVTDSTNFANAEHVAKGETAWVNGTAAFVGTAGGYDVDVYDKNRWENLAIQEPVHNIVCSEYDSVSDMTEGDEHDLGKIDSNGDSTPMLTFYERSDTHPDLNSDPDRSGKGECGPDNNWGESHTRDLTNCTLDAIGYTATTETTY